MNEKNELYGMDRLKIVCRDNLKHESKPIMRGILESIKSFQGSAHQHDDVTLTVVKVTD
jgi:sigma-B regulation protein RsbU (phosphoserine phosphatase)